MRPAPSGFYPGLCRSQTDPLRRDKAGGKGVLGCLGRVINSACRHQKQKQRTLTSIPGLRAIVFPAAHDGLSRRILDAPPPSRPAPFCKHDFQHHLLGTIWGRNGFEDNALFFDNQTKPVPGECPPDIGASLQWSIALPDSPKTTFNGGLRQCG
jgi:hypothetical protein